MKAVFLKRPGELEAVDYVIEASGSEAGIRLAVNAAGRKGKPALVGLVGMGSNREPWVTHRFSLDNVDKGFAAANDKQSFALKIMIEL